MARTLELDTIKYPGASTDNIQVGNGSVTFPSGITLDINGGTIDGTTIGASSATTGVFSSADINGGTIDGATVGASSASSGAFTTLSATGNVTLGEDATITFEGATDNSNETVLTVADPSADRTVTIPDATDTLVGKATTDVLTNKTLTSPVINTGVSGSAILDSDTMSGASATTLSSSESIKAYIDNAITNVGGKVLFKSAGKASGNPGTGKTWIAYGHATKTDDEAATYTVPGDALELIRAGPFNGNEYTFSIGTVPTDTTGSASTPGGNPNGGLMNKFGTAGYGYGDVVSINTGSGFTDYVPSGAAATWTYTLEFDDA